MVGSVTYEQPAELSNSATQPPTGAAGPSSSVAAAEPPAAGCNEAISICNVDSGAGSDLIEQPMVDRCEEVGHCVSEAAGGYRADASTACPLNQAWPHMPEPVCIVGAPQEVGTPPLCDDGGSLSSGADLNCRHLIRSPTEAEAAATAAKGAVRPADKEEKGEEGNELLKVYCKREGCRLPATKQRWSAEAKKQEDSGGVSADSLFKRAAGRLITEASDHLVVAALPPAPTLLTHCPASGSRGDHIEGQRRRRRQCSESIATSQCLVVETDGSSTIKSREQQQRQLSLQRRLGKTIKSLVASAGGSVRIGANGEGSGNRSNWPRFGSLSRTQSQQNKPINSNLVDQLQEAETVKEEDIKLQDAHSIRSETVVLSCSSSSSASSVLLLFERRQNHHHRGREQQSNDQLTNAIKNRDQERQHQHQQAASLPLPLPLPNSLSSCELPCRLQSVNQFDDSQYNHHGSFRLVRESNSTIDNRAINGKQSDQPSHFEGARRITRLRRKRKRCLSTGVQLNNQVQYSCNNSIDSVTMMSQTKCRQTGINLAKNKYIIEDKQQFAFRKEEVNNNNATDDNDTCDFLVASGGPNSSANRRGNSNDCNNPSQDQSAASLVVSDKKQQKSLGLSSAKRGGFSGPAGNGGGGGGGGSFEPGAANSRESGLKKRENWSLNIEFLLAVIGFAVDLGNIWRFPYICYRNGGGAFLIPYTIMFILGGLPIFYLEMSLGQYFSSGCLTVWKRVCPMAKGIGYAMCVLNFFTGLYYNTIISWAVFFFVESFTAILPWTSCNNSWNTGDCKTIDQRQALRAAAYNLTSNLTAAAANFSSPTKDYFEREVLQVHLSTGIDDLGSIRRPLAIYLAIVFVCIYFAIWKGVKSTGKAVWITALLPYFVLIPLLIRGVFLEGAWLGIRYYLEPQWEKIFDVDVWVEAAKQIYFSLGPGFGTLMALSSYNKFHHNCRRDAFIAASVNYFASFIAGLVVFALLGYMATIMDVSISDVATEGPGLVFQVYPEGLATMRFSSMWSVLFFIMVITLGIDSTFGGLESVITGLCDEYPRALRAHRGTFIGFLIVLIYLCSLPTTTYGGNYVIYLLESYGTSLSLIFIVLVETIVVCWIYGADRFCGNLEEMYGERPGAFWRICWKYISPTILLLIFLAACGQEFDKYHILNNGDYIYPSWAPTLGLLMTGSSVCCIPVYAIYYLKTKTSGGTFWERLKIASRPEGDPKVVEQNIHGDAMTDKISDENDIHLNVVI